MDTRLSDYLDKFSRLRTDRTGGWTAATQGQAPHKPILLLSVLHLFAVGQIKTNLIDLNPELSKLFAAYWTNVMPADRRGNLALPFFHLRSSGFWHLEPRPGMEEALRVVRQVDTQAHLERLVLGARLDDALCTLMHLTSARILLRETLLKAYFAPEFHAILLALSKTDWHAFVGSKPLVEYISWLLALNEQPGLICTRLMTALQTGAGYQDFPPFLPDPPQAPPSEQSSRVELQRLTPAINPNPLVFWKRRQFFCTKPQLNCRIIRIGLFPSQLENPSAWPTGVRAAFELTRSIGLRFGLFPLLSGTIHVCWQAFPPHPVGCPDPL